MTWTNTFIPGGAKKKSRKKTKRKKARERQEEFERQKLAIFDAIARDADISEVEILTIKLTDIAKGLPPGEDRKKQLDVVQNALDAYMKRKAAVAVIAKARSEGFNGTYTEYVKYMTERIKEDSQKREEAAAAFLAMSRRTGRGAGEVPSSPLSTPPPSSPTYASTFSLFQNRGAGEGPYGTRQLVRDSLGHALVAKKATRTQAHLRGFLARIKAAEMKAEAAERNAMEEEEAMVRERLVIEDEFLQNITKFIKRNQLPIDKGVIDTSNIIEKLNNWQWGMEAKKAQAAAEKAREAATMLQAIQRGRVARIKAAEMKAAEAAEAREAATAKKAVKKARERKARAELREEKARVKKAAAEAAKKARAAVKAAREEKARVKKAAEAARASKVKKAQAAAEEEDAKFLKTYKKQIRKAENTNKTTKFYNEIGYELDRTGKHPHYIRTVESKVMPDRWLKQRLKISTSPSDVNAGKAAVRTARECLAHRYKYQHEFQEFKNNEGEITGYYIDGTNGCNTSLSPSPLGRGAGR